MQDKQKYMALGELGDYPKKIVVIVVSYLFN